MYLDCYFHGALLGDQFPINSYGPATIDLLKKLAARLRYNFDRVEIIYQTKGCNPLPMELWPDEWNITREPVEDAT